MRKVFLGISVLLLLSSCFFYYGIEGSGRIISTSYFYSGFYSVQASGNCDINIIRGNYYSVTLICDDNLLPYINIYSDGYTLKAELLPGYSFYNSTFTVNIVMPDINHFKLDGASTGQVSGLTLRNSFTLDIFGASNAVISLTNAVDIVTDVRGASYLKISSVYPVESMDINCTGASTNDFAGISSHYSVVSIEDASSCSVNISGNIIGQVSGASTLYYRGVNSPGPILCTGMSGIVYY